MNSSITTNCTPYQAPVALPAYEAQLLNQIVGYYAVPMDAVLQSQVRSLVITWAPDQAMRLPCFAMRIAGHECMISWPNASSLPQVQDILQDIPWSALDGDLQIATLEVAFQTLLQSLDCSKLELLELPSAISDGQTVWTFRVQIEWRLGASSELSVAVRADSLAWLASRLRQFERRSSLDVGWLRVDADVVRGATELSLADIEQLSTGDQVLFAACDAHLVFRQIPLTVPGQLREGRFHPVASPEPTGLTLMEAPTTVSTNKIPLNIVTGVVTCTLAEAFHFEASLPIQELGEGQVRLQHRSQVIAQGDCGSILSRPAFIVMHP